MEEKIESLESSFFTQSQFHSLAFNSAIFDGPVRIYFAQFQEELALKLYFQIQKRLTQMAEELGERYKEIGSRVFILLYPNRETYISCFKKESGDQSDYSEAYLGEDIILGIPGTLTEEKYALALETLVKKVEIELKSIVENSVPCA